MWNKKNLYTGISLILFIIFIYWADNNLDPYKMRILILCGIYVILALSLNLVNGFTGLFSLGTAGFMAVGCIPVHCLHHVSRDERNGVFWNR